MAYARLNTRNVNAISPNFRGLGKYAALSTREDAGLRPGLRGMGDTPLTNISFGPGGQFAFSTATTPTETSLWDQSLAWMGQSSIWPGMPNSVFVVLGGAVLLAKFFGGRHR